MIQKNKICLMSIKPIFFNRIASDAKKIEYRKVAPKNSTHIFLYVSSPIKKICGIIEVEKIVTDRVDIIWQETNSVSGLKTAEYERYTKNKDIISAIFIKSFKLIEPIDPKSIFNSFVAPQNYIYIKNEKFSNLV